MIFLEMFLVFFMIGLFTIGGGYAMLPLIQEQVVTRGWMSFEAVNNFIAIAESTPGPFAVNIATIVGFMQGNQYGVFGALFGAVIATAGVVMPSFVIILLIAKYFKTFLEQENVKKALSGIAAIIVGLILSVVVTLAYANIFPDKSLKSFDLFALIIMATIFVIKFTFKKISPIILIILSGLFGFIFYYLMPIIF